MIEDVFTSGINEVFFGRKRPIKRLIGFLLACQWLLFAVEPRLQVFFGCQEKKVNYKLSVTIVLNLLDIWRLILVVIPAKLKQDRYDVRTS